MAEKSYFWTTGGAGDGATTYTRQDLADAMKAVASCATREGVSPSTFTGAGSVPGLNTVRIGVLLAMVDGKPYYNSSNVDVNIPSAVGGGNTRIDRIVLRADWTAQTVRIFRIAGTDAASPTAPAISSVSGSLYDIKLYQALVNTSGTVTLTDERVYAFPDLTAQEPSGVVQWLSGILQIGQAGNSVIADNAIDDLKLGDRAPQFYRRKGGSASVWDAIGSTNFTPGAVRMQSGIQSLTILSGAYTNTIAITFPVAFSNNPLLFITLSEISGTLNGRSFFAYYSSLSASGFTLNVRRNVNPGDENVVGATWLAIGPE